MDFHKKSEITVHELNRLQEEAKNLQILDVREDSERDHASLKGTMHIKISDIPNKKLYIANPMFVRGNSIDPIEPNILVGQEWFGEYYYPVLPKVNAYGKFDEDNLGLQGSGGENIPFGSLRRIQ